MWRLWTQHQDHFLYNWWATSSVAIVASIAALVIALLLAVLALRYKGFRIAFAPIVAGSQSFPLQALAPLLLVALGVGFTTKVFIAFVIAFFPIYAACSSALRTTPPNLLAYACVCDAGFAAGVRHIRVPAALPTVVSSAKVGFTLAVLGAVVAEFIQPDAGLGQLLLIAQSNYDVDVIYICILCLICQGLVVFISLSAIEQIILKKRGYV
jgi:ABC-type nitrate/sulfonate/bicarbonate transport system permease component